MLKLRWVRSRPLLYFDLLCVGSISSCSNIIWFWEYTQCCGINQQHRHPKEMQPTQRRANEKSAICHLLRCDGCRFICCWGWVQNESTWTVKLTQISAEVFDFHYQKQTHSSLWLSCAITAWRDGWSYVYVYVYVYVLFCKLCVVCSMFMCCGLMYFLSVGYWNYSCRK